MNELYVVMVDDRHNDPEPHLFRTEAAAIAAARGMAAGWLVEQAGSPEGLLYYAEHPTEEDALWVVKRPIEG